MDIETEIKTFVIIKSVQPESEHGNIETVAKTCITKSPVQFQSEIGDITVTNSNGLLHSLLEDWDTDTKPYNIKAQTQVQNSNQDIETDDVKSYIKNALSNGGRYDNSSSTTSIPHNIIPLPHLQSENWNITITNPLVQLQSLAEDVKTDTQHLPKVQILDQDIAAGDVKPYIAEYLLQSNCAVWNCETEIKPYTTGSPAQLLSENGNIINPLLELHNSDGDLRTDIKPLALVHSSDKVIDVKEVKPYITESLVQANAAFLNHDIDVKPYTTQSTTQLQSENLDITTTNPIGQRHTLDGDVKTYIKPYSIKPQKQNLYEDIDAEDVKPCPTKSLVGCVGEVAFVVPGLDPNQKCKSEMICNEIMVETLTNERKSMKTTSVCAPWENVLNEDNLDVYNLGCESLSKKNNVLNFKNLQQNINCIGSRPDITKDNPLLHLQHEKYACNEFGKTSMEKVSLPRNFSCRISKNNNISGDDECGKSFTRSHLFEHLLLHSGQKPHSCDECGKSFAKKGNLSIHLLTHLGQKPYSCDECGKSFTQKRNFTRHLLIHSDEKPYNCVECGKSFTRKSTFTRHLLIHSDQKPYSCEECGKSFAQKICLTPHLLIHSGQKPYYCDECGKSFTTRSHLSAHLLIHSGQKSYSCDECGKSFRRRNDLVAHLLIHSGQKPYSCDECGMSFTHKRGLKSHLLIHSDQKSYSCDECGKSFTHKNGLSKHLLTHSDQKPYSCDECGKSFKRRSDLVAHLLIHSGQKPYSCDECGKSFTTRSHLVEHFLIHSGQKPYSCDECGKSFTRRIHLLTHLLFHSGQKPYSCNECGKSFTHNSGLSKHLLTHSGQRPYSCDKCEKSFTRKCHLLAHLLIHSGQKTL